MSLTLVPDTGISLPEQKHQDDSYMWDDVSTESSTLTPVEIPEDLQKYDRIISRAETNELAETVFYRWLRAVATGEQRGDSGRGELKVPEGDFACKDNPDAFFPEEMPEVEDFLSPEDYIRYEQDLTLSIDQGTSQPDAEMYLSQSDMERLNAQRLLSESKRYLAFAQTKKICEDCPVIDACLSYAVVNHNVGYAPITSFGVWGGWGPRAREAIANAFDRKKKAYNKMTNRQKTAEKRKAMGISR